MGIGFTTKALCLKKDDLNAKVAKEFRKGRKEIVSLRPLRLPTLRPLRLNLYSRKINCGSRRPRP